MADPLGVSIAFDADWNVVEPTWTRIDTLDGCRVRGWQIDRGRPTEFDKTGTGTAVIRIVDRQGLFDPTNSSSPYAGKIVPGKQAAVSLWNPASDEWGTLFRGFVEAWSYQLDPTRQYLELELQLVDGFAILSRAELQVGEDGVIPPPEGLAEGNVAYGRTEGSVWDRIQSILRDVDWPDELAVRGSDVFSGNVRVGPKAYGPGTSALDALWDAADAEFPGVSNMWMGGPISPGHLIFHGRQARFHPDVAEYGIGHWTVGDPSAWESDVDVVPVAELEWVMGSDNLYNAASATPQGILQDDDTWRMINPDPPSNDDIAGQYVTADQLTTGGDLDSITKYGLRSITFDQLQTLEGIHTGNDSMAETKLFASFYVTNYSEPHPRISRLVFKSRRPGDAPGGRLWRFICNVEISDLLTLKTTHPGGGGFTDYVDDGAGTQFYVEGIHYTGQPGNPDIPVIIELSLDVSPAAAYTVNPFDADPDTPDT